MDNKTKIAKTIQSAGPNGIRILDIKRQAHDIGVDDVRAICNDYIDLDYITFNKLTDKYIWNQKTTKHSPGKIVIKKPQGTQAERVLTYLNDHPDKDGHLSQEIAEILDIKPASMLAALSRLNTEKKIVRIDDPNHGVRKFYYGLDYAPIKIPTIKDRPATEQTPPESTAEIIPINQNQEGEPVSIYGVYKVTFQNNTLEKSHETNVAGASIPEALKEAEDQMETTDWWVSGVLFVMELNNWPESKF